MAARGNGGKEENSLQVPANYSFEGKKGKVSHGTDAEWDVCR